MKTLLVFFSGLLISNVAMAQEIQSTKSFWTDPFNDPLLPVYTATFFVFVVLVLVLLTAVYALKVLNLMIRRAEEENAARRGVPYVAKQSAWTSFLDRFNASVPVSKEMDIDLGHNFDGIRELDNHLPPWWKGLYYGSIIWGVIYLVVYHVIPVFPLSIGEYENELAVAEDQARILRASRPVEAIDENALVFSDDTEVISKGKAVFASSNCASCHRLDGGGSTIGPNLTDAYWLHGGEIKDIFLTIKVGVIDKGMPAWGKVMSPADVKSLAFYVMSLQGSNPPNAKAPQGQLFRKPVKADSTISIK